MELILNLVWAVLACAGILSWMHADKSTDSSKRTQVVALLMLIVILFPVISVTDDIWAAQNPAETDSCIRRHELIAQLHILPGAAIPATQAFHDYVLTRMGQVPLEKPALFRLQVWSGSRLFTRPPPTA